MRHIAAHATLLCDTLAWRPPELEADDFWERPHISVYPEPS